MTLATSALSTAADPLPLAVTKTSPARIVVVFLGLWRWVVSASRPLPLPAVERLTQRSTACCGYKFIYILTSF